MKAWHITAALGAVCVAQRLVVTTVPDHVRPYVVRAYTLDGVVVGPQVYRFPVTGASSGGAFTLISTAAGASDELGVLPHQHCTHYENFFCLRGSFQLWAEKDDTSVARLLTTGDYGAVPQNTTHTFQLLSPVNEMVGVISPGGFEALFYALATSNYSSPINAPFPVGANVSSGGSDASVISSLQSFDVWAQLAFSPRRDIVNGSAPPSDWHAGDNALAPDSTTPFFVASGRGPQYLTNATGFWQIISPFITPAQSDGNFTEGVLTLSQPFSESYLSSSHKLGTHTALEVTQGELTIAMQGEVLHLLTGDVAFIPAGTPFTYWSRVAYTTVLYVGGGRDALDQSLLAKAMPWTGPIFPSN